MRRLRNFPFYQQLDAMDCGPTCLKMIAEFHGRKVDLPQLREHCHLGKTGASFAGLSKAAETIGFHSLAVFLDFSTLKDEVNLPCIAHWKQAHFVVVYSITDQKVTIGDPALGLMRYTPDEFLEGWSMGAKANQGHLLLLEAMPDFKMPETGKRSSAWRFLGPYFREHHRAMVQLLVGIAFASFLQLLLPFLTQAVVDYGIHYEDLNFIHLMLLAQVIVFVSLSTVEVIRGWIVRYLVRKVNLRLVSDFLLRLMCLPMAYFDSKHSGDIIQRIHDNQKLHDFLSSSTLMALFGLFTVLVFGLALWYYHTLLFLVFLMGTLAYLVWSLAFLKRLSVLDNQRFLEDAQHQKSIWQLVSGMSEIKLNGSEQKRRWAWEGIQIRLFHLSGKRLTTEQRQQYGGLFLVQLTQILIAFLAAKYVIDGSLTLGVLLSISFIMGQVNLPLGTLVHFMQSAQEAKLSLERMLEIHGMPLEQLTGIPMQEHGTLTLNTVSFWYGARTRSPVLKDISLVFPQGKVTALVGRSGSGKTTLLKLLLRFYGPTSGDIQIGGVDLNTVSLLAWRSACGTVLQDGFVFEDTLLANIMESETGLAPDQRRLKEAIALAHLDPVIAKLPSGIHTLVGSSGVALSGGERQRVLLARAIYKNPDYLFFDEATSALDTITERTIMGNLQYFFKGRTVILIAHRLSTVKDADHIVVLEQGHIVEQGTHSDLLHLKGSYAELVQDQLNLGE